MKIQKHLQRKINVDKIVNINTENSECAVHLLKIVNFPIIGLRFSGYLLTSRPTCHSDKL